MCFNISNVFLLADLCESNADCKLKIQAEVFFFIKSMDQRAGRAV